jgi:hypothetical protein
VGQIGVARGSATIGVEYSGSDSTAVKPSWLTSF